MVLIQPLVLELYRQVTKLIFDLGLDEQHATGAITANPELQQIIPEVWEDVWKMYDFCQKPRAD